jgi:hypothetical protein
LAAYVTICCSIFAQNNSFNSLKEFNSDAVVIQLSENAYAEILPEIELLSGVQSQTTWIERMGPLGEGNKYFRRLKSFFEKYKDHKAVEITQDLLDDGFSFDAPPGFILNLGPLPELKVDSIPEYYNKRANGSENLERFRMELKNLSEESNFMEFFLSERKYLKEVIDSTLRGFDAQRITNWLNNFFGYKGDEFHIVFAPAMFPGGGYSAEKSIGSKKIIFQVIRDQNTSQDKPIFCDPVSLVSLTFHEFGHGFINPAFDEQKKLIDEFNLEELLDPVEDKMKRMAYPSFETFFNELHIRAMTILAMEDYAGSKIDKTKMLETERGKGFYLIDFAYDKLKQYKEGRKEYSTFKDYLPALLKEYSNYKDELLKLAE